MAKLNFEKIRVAKLKNMVQEPDFASLVDKITADYKKKSLQIPSIDNKLKINR